MSLTTLILHGSEIIQDLSFCDWLLLLSIMSSGFIHVVCVRISFIIFHCVYIYDIFCLFIHLLMDICFCLLAAVHNAFMNMDVQTCPEILLSVLLNKHQEVVLLGHMVIQFFFF